MVGLWYGMVNVDLYSAIITKVSNALYSGSWDFLYGQCKQIFVSELNNAYFSRHILNQCLNG